MAKNTPATPGTKHTIQNIFNWTFDEDFGVVAVELLGYDSTNNVLRRLVCDENGQIMTSGGAAAATYYILQENGDALLAENGNYLITENGS